MILSTSDIKKLNLHRGRRIYLTFTVLCFVFAVVYEHFSHEVYSPYMVFAAGFPLIGGVVGIEVLCCLPAQYHPNRLSINLYNSGIATVTVGSLLQGALDIYGTENSLMRYYWKTGVFLLGAAIIAWTLSLVMKWCRRRRNAGGQL